MSTVQTSVRASQATLDKWSWLAERYGTKTEVLAIAIDRLYQDEQYRAAFNPQPNHPSWTDDLVAECQGFSLQVRQPRPGYYEPVDAELVDFDDVRREADWVELQEPVLTGWYPYPRPYQVTNDGQTTIHFVIE